MFVKNNIMCSLKRNMLKKRSMFVKNNIMCSLKKEYVC